MGMKPRLNDGPVPMEGLATQAKKVSEDSPLPSNLVNQRKNEPAKELKGTEKP